jgi:putative MATE family efflux protein
LVAGIHGVIDQLLIGRYVGYEGQGAVGVSWQLFLVVVVFISSLFHGMNILIARYTGRQDRDAVARIFYHVLLMTVYLQVFVLAPCGWIFAPSALDWIGVDPAIKVHALPYMRILFTGSTPLFLMFIFSGAFQSSGNPKIPMFLGILTAAMNVILSYVLITGSFGFPELGTLGAAVGTALGPLPSVLVAFWLVLSRRVLVTLPSDKTLVPDLSIIRSVSRIGIPSGIQAVLLNLGGAVLMYFVNKLPEGKEAIAAYTVCYAQIFSVVTWTGFGLRAACATVLGQNMGAGQIERGTRAVYIGAGIAFCWAVFFGALFLGIPETILGWFSMNNDTVVQGIAIQLLRFLAFSGIFVAVTLAFTGGLQGAGDTKKPMYIAFFTQVMIMLGVCFVFDRMGLLSTTVIWSAILAGHASRFTLSLAAFLHGGWKNIQVTLHTDDADDVAGISDASPEPDTSSAK